MTIATPIADMIAEMHESGIQLGMIISAVRSMERASTRLVVDETAERRRAWDREYRKNKRARPPDPPDIHPKPPDIALTSLSEVKKHSEVVSKKERIERGCKLPPDWIPKAKHYDEGAKLGMSRAAVDERGVRMREWCDANANRSITTKANWDQAFMGTWIKGSNNAQGSSHPRAHQAAGSPPTRDAAVIASLGRTLERRRAARAADRSGDEELFGDAGAAGEPAADASTASGDDEPHGKLALMAAADARG